MQLDIPADMVEQANEYREKLIDTIVELDDDVLTAYFDVGGERSRPRAATQLQPRRECSSSGPLNALLSVRP